MKLFGPAYYRFKFLLCLLVLPLMLSAQNTPADSPEEILKKRQEIFKLIQASEDPYKDSLWYHGRIYEFELKSQVGTPYFFNTETMAGSLTFNGELHEDLILSYNLVMDELILWVKGNDTRMIQLVLNKYYVDSFTLSHHNKDFHFRLNTEDDPIHDQLEEGFYEVAYDNVVRMFVRHKKVFHFDANKVDHYSYRYEKEVYLILEGNIYIINKRRDYLKAFEDHKKSLRGYMRKANINFEKSGTQIISSLGAYTKSLLAK